MPKLLRRFSLAGTLALLVTLILAGTAAATPFDGTGGYFIGDGNTTDYWATPPNPPVGDPDLAWNGTAGYATDNFADINRPDSLSLDGSTTLTDPDTSVGNLGSGDFTIGLHYKLGVNPGGDAVQLLSKEPTCNNNNPWFQIDLTPGGVYVQFVGADSVNVNGGQGNWFVGAVSNLYDTNWHDLQLNRIGDTLYLLLDGQELTTHPFTGVDPANNGSLTLGGGSCTAVDHPHGGEPLDKFTGEMSYVYLGGGSTYSLSFPNGSNTDIQAGTTNPGPELHYGNDFGTVMHTSATSPVGAFVQGMVGPSGCGNPGTDCTQGLTGTGTPITPQILMPSYAAPGSVHAGTIKMTDIGVPLDPDTSTGYDPNTGYATIPYSVTALNPLITCAVSGTPTSTMETVHVTDSGQGISSVPVQEIYNGTISIPVLSPPQTAFDVTATRGTLPNTDTIWWFIPQDVDGAQKVCS